MDNEKVVLIARVKVRHDAIEEGKKVALATLEGSRAEVGNINYDIHQAIDDPAVFVWHETWKSKSAIDEHFETDFFKEFAANIGKIVAEPPQITITKMISIKEQE